MKIDKNSILQEAKEIRDFTNRNKALPKYATINNSQLTPPQYSYILAKQIANINTKNIEKITVKTPSNSNGDKVDMTIYKNDYINIAQRVSNYIEQHNQAPNYVAQDKKHIKFELYTYCFAKILAFFKENQYLPNYCSFKSTDLSNTNANSTNTKKTTTTSTSNSTKNTKSNTTSVAKKDNCTNPYTSSPHLTTTKSGLGQEYPWDCSANATSQCLYKLSGKKISEKTLIQVGGVTTVGVGHEGINTMIAWFNKKYGTNYKVQWKTFSSLGNTMEKRFESLAKLICKPNTAVLCHIGYSDSGSKIGSQIFGHYEVLDKINTKTKYVRALNSLGNKINSNAYAGHLQDRSYTVQANYFASTPGNQKALCIITK